MQTALRISTIKRSTTSRGSYAAQGGSGPAPTVTSATPLAGDPAGGTAVTLAGTGFVTGATVTFGGTAATSVVVVSGLSITCVTPSGTAGPKNVVVTNPDAQTGTLTNGYAYVTVTSVSPTTGVVGTTITITGTGFASGQAVLIGGTAADNIVYTSSTSIAADVPSGVSGLVGVSVAGVTLANAVTVWTWGLPSVTYAEADFEDSTLGGFASDVSANGTVAVSADYAYAGTKSCKCAITGTSAETALLKKTLTNNPFLNAAGVYFRWRMLCSQATLDNAVAGQIKVHLTRNIPVAGARWEVFGLGNQLNGGGGVAGDLAIVDDFSGGETFQSQRFYTMTALTWVEIILWCKRSAGSGQIKLWVDRVLEIDDTQSVYGEDGATTSYQPHVGVGYCQGQSGALTVYLDDCLIADGIPD